MTDAAVLILSDETRADEARQGDVVSIHAMNDNHSAIYPTPTRDCTV